MSEINFQDLAKPFDRSQVKTKRVEWTDKTTKQKKSYSADYITARHVMNRLDEVCKPWNWRTEFSSDGLPPKSIRCTLYLRVDGEWIGKSDVGTMTDIEPEKGMVSDALKRAAVHWGIGRELYREGIADLSDLDDAQPEPNTPPQSQNAPSKPRATKTGSSTPANGNGAQAANSEPDPVKVLAAETFPFEASWKGKDWQTLISEDTSWNVAFWPTVRSLGLTNDDLHTALGVETLNAYQGGVGQMWLEVCKLSIAKRAETEA